MIAKISKGSNFRGLSDYLTKDDRGQVLDMRNLSSDNPEAAAGEMQLAAGLSARTKSPVMHISVSYDPADGPVSDDQMREDAAEVLKGQGLDRNQAVIIRHDDAGHRHFHMMINRVGPDGRAVSDSNSYARAEHSMRRLEVRHGYAGTPGRHAPEYGTGARMTGPRTSADPRQAAVPPGVKDTLTSARSWPELDKGLQKQGWKLETVRKGGRPAGGLLIGPQGQRIASGKANRQATMGRLEARLGPRDGSPKAPTPTPNPTPSAPVLGLSPRTMAAGGIVQKVGGKPGRKLRKGKLKSRMNAGAQITSQLAAGMTGGL